METFIVLGFCFILYEALDFFQSCYSNNNRHQHLQSSNTTDNLAGNATNSNDSIKSVPISDVDAIANANLKRIQNDTDISFVCSSSESINLNEDNVQLLATKIIEEYDSDSNNNDDIYDDDDHENMNQTIDNNQSNQNVYSICDRISNHNHQQLIDYNIVNKNTNFNSEYDKLIVG